MAMGEYNIGKVRETFIDLAQAAEQRSIFEDDVYFDQKPRTSRVPMTTKSDFPAIAALICSLAIASIGVGRAADREALWKIVHDQCMLA